MVTPTPFLKPSGSFSVKTNTSGDPITDLAERVAWPLLVCLSISRRRANKIRGSSLQEAVQMIGVLMSL